MNQSETSKIRRTKAQNLNIPRLILQLPLSNPLKPIVKPSVLSGGWKCSRSSADTLLQLHLINQQVYYLLRCGLY